MLFSSTPFLFWFLPSVLILYFIVSNKLKNAVLLLSSLFFYGWGEPRYVVWMVLAIIMGYMFGRLMDRFRKEPTISKILLVLSISSSLAMLGYFKYVDFFIGNFNAMTGLSVPLLQITLPIGISFYTFQILSYTIDVYRGDVVVQKNPIDLATYVALFPQLIAGPIVRYSDIANQLKKRTHSFKKTALGMRRFIIGLGKKIMIANLLGELCNIFRESDNKSVLFFWLYAVAYSLHIYFDFSGYSDMAIGLGKIFGFNFLENFHYPYISASITEFWRRWHISLGSWFRDYIYIPLGGNRVSAFRHLFNIFLVWMLTGFWHGAAWNFIVWGLYFAILLIIEKLWLFHYLKKSRILSHVYVMTLVIISFVIFDAVSMGQAFSYIKAMFGAGGYSLISAEFLYYLRSYGVVLILAMIGATPLPQKLWNRVSATSVGGNVMILVEPLAISALLVVCTAYLIDGSYNPFLYFRF
ncbi:MAG: MBOAT family protein [Lachnospiraceae bacterium]|nr:MBOAT family protein [Lachnospiraceae bacterium]